MNNENKTPVMLSVSTTGLRTHQRARDELILWNPRYTLARTPARAYTRVRARVRAEEEPAAFSKLPAPGQPDSTSPR